MENDTLKRLRVVARAHDVQKYYRMRKNDLIHALKVIFAARRIQRFMRSRRQKRNEIFGQERRRQDLIYAEAEKQDLLPLPERLRYRARAVRRLEYLQGTSRSEARDLLEANGWVMELCVMF